MNKVPIEAYIALAIWAVGFIFFVIGDRKRKWGLLGLIVMSIGLIAFYIVGYIYQFQF